MAVTLNKVYVPILADQVVRQAFHLLSLATWHHEPLQILEVFGLQQFLVLTVLADECQHSLLDLRGRRGINVMLH